MLKAKITASFPKADNIEGFKEAVLWRKDDPTSNLDLNFSIILITNFLADSFIS